MELSPSDKGRIEHQFDSFCKLVLVCEMKDYKKMILRKMAKEILFSELILIYGYDLEHKKVGQEEIISQLRLWVLILPLKICL